MVKLKIFILLFSTMFFFSSVGQELKRQLTLDEVIEIAQEQSPDALSAKNRFLKAFWEMRTSEARLYPQLSLNATIPNFSRAIVSVTQPDGTQAFREISQANTFAELSLSKNVGLTGGNVYLKSNLRRIDYLDSDSSAWLSSPLKIG